MPSVDQLGSIAETAQGVRSGAVSATGLLEAFINRINAGNDALNALVALRLDGARADARRIDEQVAAGVDPGPLAGIPFSAKDVLATVDLPTTCGSRLLAGSEAGYDATVVARARRAGAILVGKSNCPEFAFGVDTANDLFGRTINPLGPFTAGGSSGGEAAAVAAGFSAFGLGSDFGGSIRWPAQCAALVGLRPTIGRLPGTGQLPAIHSRHPSVANTSTLQGLVQVIGPLARSVADAALVLDVLKGSDGLDPAAVDEPLRDYRGARLADVEMRWGTDVAGITAEAEVAAAVSSAADVLGEVVHRVEHGLPRAVDEAAAVYSELRELDPLAEIRHLAHGREFLLTGFISSLLAREQSDRSSLPRLLAERARLVVELSEWLLGERVLVLPIAAAAPFQDLGSIRLQGRAASGFELVTPSRAISLFGLPAVSVPRGQTADGRPLSVQVVAPPFREDLALAVALALQHPGQSK